MQLAAESLVCRVYADLRLLNNLDGQVSLVLTAKAAGTSNVISRLETHLYSTHAGLGALDETN